jgi:hypothetical protein
MEPPGQLGLIEKQLLSLRRNPDGSVVEKSAKSAKSSNSKTKKLRKRAKKLSKSITEKKRQRMLAKAAAIVDPQRREATLTFIGKMSVAQPKTKSIDDFIGKSEKKVRLAAGVRAMYEEQLIDPDPVRRDRAWMALNGIKEEAGR